MDLSFTLRTAWRAPALDWAVLVSAAAARQAVSPTAAAQAQLDRPPPASGRFAPTDGRFSASAAGKLAEWKQG